METRSLEKQLTYPEIARAARRLTKEQRLTLIHDVLYSLSETEPDPVSLTNRATADEVLGMLANDKPAPTDEEVKRMLHERREEKYG